MKKYYKLRVVVPSQLSNAKTPESGFIIQQSKSTGIRSDSDSSATSISTLIMILIVIRDLSVPVLSHHQQLQLLQNFLMI